MRLEKNLKLHSIECDKNKLSLSETLFKKKSYFLHYIFFFILIDLGYNNV